MGGQLSSRWAGHRRRATLAEAHLSVIAREVATLPVGACGAIEWTARSKTRLASVGFRIVAIAHSPTRRTDLSWRVIGARGTAEHRNASLVLEPTLLTFGTRWWLRCPRCGHRRSVLYLPTPRDHWQCRVCARLGYLTQRLTPSDRHTHRVESFVRRRLGAGWTPHCAHPPRPKGMHRGTYRRRVEALMRMECQRDDFFLLEALDLMRRGWGLQKEPTSR